MIIRKFRKKDAQQVSKLVSKTFKRFVSPDFSKKASSMFLKECRADNIVKRSKEKDIFVAVINNKIVGKITVKKEGSKIKISRLFVDNKYHRKGIAKCLLQKIEQLARRKKVKTIITWSSLYAREFYQKQGFKKCTGLIRRKNGFIYQPMKKKL